MAYVQCTRCKRIRESSKAEWQLAKATCTGCFAVGTWRTYTGPVAGAILAEEDVQHEILSNKYRSLRIAYETADAAYKKLEQDYKRKETYTKEELLKLVTEIQLCQDSCADMNRQMKAVGDQLDDLGNRPAVKRDAQVAYSAAASQGELYVGNRQLVSTFKGGHAAKILDVPNWSWGLNCSWVEGGISAKAHFTVKVDPDNPYTQIPMEIQTALASPLSYDEFLDLCKTHGRNSLLWFDRDGANRPTWTALEMATLLRAGYRFAFGAVIELTPPAGR